MSAPGSRSRLAVGAAAAVVLALVTACGVPGESDFQQIDSEDIPYGLDATTTSTTIASTTSSASSTTIARQTTTEPATTSTSTSTTVPVEVVTLFWVTGAELFPTSRLLLSPAAPPQVLTALLEGPPEGDIAAGLRSAIPEDTEMTVGVERGVATVELPPAFITDVPGGEQRLAVAQIVLTLTRRGGLGQVTFTIGGVPQAVPRGRGDLTEPGDLVSCDDYENLLGPGLGC